MEGWDLRIKKKLKKIYPNGIVKNITTKDSTLYHHIWEVMTKKNISLKDYIESLGFQYENGWKEELTEEEAIKFLEKLFPKKVIKNVSDIAKRNMKVYSFIKQYSKKNEINVVEYLDKIGFKYINTNRDTKYDIKTLKKLYKEYTVNKTELSEILGTTKQNLDQKLRVKKVSKEFWQTEDFTDEEKNIIIKTIRERNYYSVDMGKFIIRIYFNKKNNGNNAVLIKNSNKIKCKFELPNEIIKEMKLYGFDKYKQQDIEILKLIYSDSSICQISKDENGKNTLKIIDSKLRGKINSRASCLKMKINEYVKYIGFELVNNRKYTDKDIKKLLSKYLIKDNVVKIPTESREYINIFRIYKNRGYSSLKEFITSYGYKYERIREVGDINRRYKDIIRKNYLVEDNKVYINSLDPFYSRIYAYAYKNKLSLDEYIRKLGYERISNIINLPKDYKQFDWKAEEYDKLKDVYSNEKILEILEKFSNENNEIYLDTTSQMYWNLWRICNIRGIKINELLEILGLKRVYIWDGLNDEKAYDSKRQIENEQNFINSMIRKLKEIQGNLDKDTIEIKKKNRSQSLVKTLKKMYHYKCQLCCPDESGFSVPPIEKENEELYVEVHHIIPISEESKTEDESNIVIDSYQNAIVVCSYHHKYLHYFHGGFREIIKGSDGEYYFKSKLGEKLKIYTNYHLKVSGS